MITRHLAFTILFLPVICLASPESEKCFDKVYELPELGPIVDKVSWVKKPSFEEFANTAKATEQEKPLIARYANELMTCQDIYRKAQSSDTHPKIIKAVDDYYNARTNALLDLYNQKISYGDYAKQQVESKSKTDLDIANVDREIDEYNRAIEAQNSRAQAMQEARERQAWSDAISGGLKGMSDSIQNRPKSINCNPNGFGGVVCR